VINTQVLVVLGGALAVLEPDHLPELLLAVLTVEMTQNLLVVIKLILLLPLIEDLL
jgi:hypothetical protein